MRWTKKEVIYHILVDRFSPVDPEKATKPVFAGGTIQGIIEHIPYFKDLGVTALMLSPIYKTNAYHGYHITDFMSIDERFGTLDDFKELIKKCHKNNIKVIMDYVPNHVSSAHPFFVQAHHEKKKGFKDWFYLNKSSYQTFLGHKDLPKLNLDNFFTRSYIIDAAVYWLAHGADGLRLDHAIGPSMDFWKEFKKEVKKMYPETLLIGEVWADNLSWSDLSTTKAKNKLLKWLLKQKTEDYMKDYTEVFDGCLDFTFNKLLREYIFFHEDKSHFSQTLQKHYESFPSTFMLPVFLDNHDMDRFYFDCRNKTQYKQAIDMLFAQHQPVIIYYGDESGMTQKNHARDFESHGDLVARQPMNWDNMDAEIVEYFKDKIKERKK